MVENVTWTRTDRSRVSVLLVTLAAGVASVRRATRATPSLWEVPALKVSLRIWCLHQSTFTLSLCLMSGS